LAPAPLDPHRAERCAAALQRIHRSTVPTAAHRVVAADVSAASRELQLRRRPHLGSRRPPGPMRRPDSLEAV
jgi:hypothetical protein